MIRITCCDEGTCARAVTLRQISAIPTNTPLPRCLKTISKSLPVFLLALAPLRSPNDAMGLAGRMNLFLRWGECSEILLRAHQKKSKSAHEGAVRMHSGSSHPDGRVLLERGAARP